MSLRTRGRLKYKRLPALLVRKATVESHLPVRCFFWYRYTTSQTTEITDTNMLDISGRHIVSHSFTPTKELTVPFGGADRLYCYVDDEYAAAVDNDNIYNNNDDDALAVRQADENMFRLFLETNRGQNRVVRVSVPPGQVLGTLDLFTAQERLTTGVVAVSLIDSPPQQQQQRVSENFAAAPEASFDLNDVVDADEENEEGMEQGPFPDFEDIDTGRSATCYVALHPRGVRTVSRNQYASFIENGETLRGITCFRAGHSLDDVEQWRSGDSRLRLD